MSQSPAMTNLPAALRTITFVGKWMSSLRADAGNEIVRYQDGAVRKRSGARGISDRDMGHRQDIRRSPNSAGFLRRYQEAGVGSLVKLIVLEGQGHNYFEDFFHSQELVDFAIARARAGANF